MDFFTTLLHCQPKSLGIHKNINKQNNLLETIAVAVLAIATTTAVNSMKKTSQSKQIATSPSVSILVIFMLMDVALLVRRYYITASSIGTSSDWRLRPHYWTGYIVTIPLWFLGTLGISIFCPAEDTNSLGGSQGGNAGLLHFLSLHITYDVEYQQKMLSPEG
ncbi:hypothetical protein Goshw_006983 [Gossypium schwendimanii]|uniref:Uncharacterized protein n=1 Tax=Gossypium schwendimanii TaxID=34291 RepID=A0A7J9M249_GOSSC|nr:hypothetical protein [Gossypium schwendimanii]